MTIINDTTVVVFTSAELKTVLEGTNNYNYIYFGANITLTAGIKIASTKTNITIDGTYQNVRYTYEDMKNLSASNTIYVSSSNTTKVTVQNMDITGYNYYGVIYVPESNTYANTVIEYNNVTYEGHQMIFHPNGLTRIISSKITIGDASTTTGNEVAECNKIEIGGTTTINHLSKSNSSFWFRNTSPSFTILENAIVNFTSESRELIYGTNALTFTINNNAYLSCTTKNGLAYGNFGTGTTIINKNATFVLKQTAKNGNYATWYVYGALTMEEGSTLKIINNFDSIGTSNYNIFFSSANASFNLYNPKEVVLYNTTANCITTSNTINYNFEFSRLNLFTNTISLSDSITKDTHPTYSWYKENEISTISGTFTLTTTAITKNNFTASELESLPALSNFNLAGKKIISIGTTPLRINAITDVATIIKGFINPNASVLIEYESTITSVTANNEGLFTHEMTSTLPIGTKLKFTAKDYNNVIYTTKIVEIVYPGELTLDSATSPIFFKLEPISTNPIICPKNSSITIKITDTRVDNTPWNLYAAIKNDLTSENDYTLPFSLIFIDENNIKHYLSTEKTLIYENTTSETPKITNITYEENKGILLELKNPIINNNTYKTNINWSIEEDNT